MPNLLMIFACFSSAFPNMADEFARDTTKAEAEHIIKDEALAEEVCFLN